MDIDPSSQTSASPAWIRSTSLLWGMKSFGAGDPRQLGCCRQILMETRIFLDFSLMTMASAHDTTCSRLNIALGGPAIRKPKTCQKIGGGDTEFESVGCLLGAFHPTFMRPNTRQLVVTRVTAGPRTTMRP